MRRKIDKDRDKPIHSIKNDKWDWDLFNDLLKEIKAFAKEHDTLNKTVANAPELWADAFWSLWKITPGMENIEDMKPSHMIDHTVMEALQELEDYAKLHSYCRGDTAAAAQATMSMRPRIEEIWDRTEKHQDLAKELEEKLQELQQLLQQQIQQAMQSAGGDDEDEDGEGQPGGSGAGGQQQDDSEGEDDSDDDSDSEDDSDDDSESESDEDGNDAAQQLQQRIDNVQDMIDRLKDQMEQERNSQVAHIRKQLEQGVKEALADAANVNAMASLSYGTQKGSLTHMPVEERLELARKLSDEKFRKVAQLLGPMKRYAESARRRKTKDSEEEIVDIDLGNEISKIVPSEFAKLSYSKYTRLLFMKDFFSEKLPEYKLDGVEPVGRGDIICCVDTSGSMGGDREVWAKAVALALLHISRQQDRGFYAMNFSSYGQCKEYNFGKEVPFDVDQVVAFAGDAFWGGTDYRTPLDRSLARLEAEYKRTGDIKADVVFISDGECWVDDKWMAKFKEAQERLQFKVWGVLVGGTRSTPALEEICDGKIISTEDIVSGRNLDNIWQAM